MISASKFHGFYYIDKIHVLLKLLVTLGTAVLKPIDIFVILGAGGGGGGGEEFSFNPWPSSLWGLIDISLTFVSVADKKCYNTMCFNK